MGLFEKLFGKKPASEPRAADPRIAELLREPPRLINEGPEFPREPIVLRREVTPPQLDGALGQAGFARGGDGRWTRGETVVEHRVENGVTLLAFSGGAVLEAQRELLSVLPWIDPTRGFYDAMRSPATPVVELRYLLGALRHYNCVGGVPMELRRNPDPEIQETIRQLERDKMAATARAQRARKRG